MFFLRLCAMTYFTKVANSLCLEELLLEIYSALLSLWRYILLEDEVDLLHKKLCKDSCFSCYVVAHA